MGDAPLGDGAAAWGSRVIGLPGTLSNPLDGSDVTELNLPIRRSRIVYTPSAPLFESLHARRAAVTTNGVDTFTFAVEDQTGQRSAAKAVR